MGCSYGKTSAITELNELIKKISAENAVLEKERDKLRSQHDDKPEEERGTMHDLKQMHVDLEKELYELKTIMMEFMPHNDSSQEVSLSLKKGLERINKFQVELELTSTKIKEMITKREEIKKEQLTFEDLILDTESQIAKLEKAIADQEEVLKDQENFEEKLQMYEKQKQDLLEELKEAEKIYKELSKETQPWDETDLQIEDNKNSLEYSIATSEVELNRELKNVEKQIEAYTTEIKELEMKDLELQHMDEYIMNLQNKMSSNSKNEILRQQIAQSEERIEMLKIEKKRIKSQVLKKKKISGENFDLKNSKYNPLISEDQDQMDKILHELEPYRQPVKTFSSIVP